MDNATVFHFISFHFILSESFSFNLQLVIKVKSFSKNNLYTTQENYWFPINVKEIHTNFYYYAFPL